MASELEPINQPSVAVWRSKMIPEGVDMLGKVLCIEQPVDGSDVNEPLVLQPDTYTEKVVPCAAPGEGWLEVWKRNQETGECTFVAEEPVAWHTGEPHKIDEYQRSARVRTIVLALRNAGYETHFTE